MSDHATVEARLISYRRGKFRFGVEKEGAGFSNMWFADQSGDDIYIGARGARGSTKISLHASGICHIKGGSPETRDAISRWRRRATPTSGAVRVISIDFPTDYIFHWKRMERLTARQLAFQVNAAPAGCAVEFSFLYSREHPDQLAARMPEAGAQLVFFDLPSGEFVSVWVRSLPFDRARVPSGPKSMPGAKLALPAEGIGDLSMIAWTEPRDDQPLWVTSLQGIRLISRDHAKT